MGGGMLKFIRVNFFCIFFGRIVLLGYSYLRLELLISKIIIDGINYMSLLMVLVFFVFFYIKWWFYFKLFVLDEDDKELKLKNSKWKIIVKIWNDYYR